MKKEILKNSLYCYTDDDHRFTLDSVILADALPSFFTAAELCAGTGVIGLSVINNNCFIDFVEISHSAAKLLKQAVMEQNLTTASVFCEDARDFAQKNGKKYDLVFFNPPYYKQNSGKIPQNTEIANQKFELQGTLNEFILAAKQLLSTDGRLLFCIKPERKNEALKILEIASFYTDFIRDYHSDSNHSPFLSVFCAGFNKTKTVFLKEYLK